jgi:hypothetical protein
MAGLDPAPALGAHLAGIRVLRGGAGTFQRSSFHVLLRRGASRSGMDGLHDVWKTQRVRKRAHLDLEQSQCRPDRARPELRRVNPPAAIRVADAGWHGPYGQAVHGGLTKKSIPTLPQAC